ncbi:MAG: thioredoxin-disulfide reductase [Patescibacteria group bacterium]
MKDIIIIGSGPAGMTAAIYTARAQLSPLVAAGLQWGGLLMWTTEVENFPGWPEAILGPELMGNMKKQAEKFGAEFVLEDVAEVDFSTRPYRVKIGETWHEAKSVIVAAGTKPKVLKLPGEKQLIGKGLSVCATCDGAFFRDKEVIVIGGGDSAMEEAMFLTKFARRVRLLVRSDRARASKIMFERVQGNPKIEVLFNTEVTEYLTENNLLSGVKIFNNQTQETGELPASGLFFAIGHMPSTKIFDGQLETDEAGYLVVKNQTRSNKEGIFIAGDIEDKNYRQAITAAGSGCKAAIDAIRWLQEN